MQSSVNQIMKKYFGFTDFKPGQKDIVDSILQNHDTVAILPTGGGKSLCYQLPALILPGITLVISPLIALMKDQVDALNIQGISATLINSSLSGNEVNQRLYQASQNKYRLIYVAPERLQSEQFSEMLQKLPISLAAIDEAHCISQWGHDFRPSYMGIGAWISSLPQRPLIAAFTATATARVREDIIVGLGLQKTQVYINSFDRPNLRLVVEKTGDRKRFIKHYLQEHQGQAGIIYAATRKEVDSLHKELNQQGLQVAKYHAGMSSGDRSTAQEDFIYDHVQAIVATNAFGLGIDKSNARFVIHHNMPRHLEAYYQEAGRAGRDGDSADCILLYQAGDIQVQKYLIEQSLLSLERKEMEYAKLQIMIDYCHTSSCLRSYILDYFGEFSTVNNCENCSNCIEYELQDVTVEAQKVFSCIYRMQQQYGSSLVAAVLSGSKQKRVIQLGFDQLSTYGIMSSWKSAQLVEFINLLTAEGYLSSSGGKYPIVSLTSSASPILRGQEKLMIRMPPSSAPVTVDNEVYEALRLLRQKIARQENVPPYIVFSDTTLKEMAIRLPQTRETMLDITGVGEIKLEKYGGQFMEEIKLYMDKLESGSVQLKQQEKSSDSSSVNSYQNSPQNNKIPTYMLSWQMYSEGKSLQDIAYARNLTLITIQSHIIQAVRNGYQVEWDHFINPRQEEQIIKAAHKAGTQRLNPLKESLPKEIDYFMIRMALVKNGLEHDPAMAVKDES